MHERLLRTAVVAITIALLGLAVQPCFAASESTKLKGKDAVASGLIAIGDDPAPFSLQTLDGNTVDTEQEHTAFSANALEYQASLNFLNGKINGLRKALKGE